MMVRPGSWWVWTFIAVLLGILSAPVISHQLFRSMPASLAGDAQRLPPDELLVGSKLGWAGFVVYPDGTALPKHIPALHWTAFRSVIQRSGIETTYHPLLANEDVLPPFSLLVAVGVPHYRSGAYFAGPAALLERRDIRYWRVRQQLLPHYKLPIWRKLTILSSHLGPGSRMIIH